MKEAVRALHQPLTKVGVVMDVTLRVDAAPAVLSMVVVFRLVIIVTIIDSNFIGIKIMNMLIYILLMRGYCNEHTVYFKTELRVHDPPSKRYIS